MIGRRPPAVRVGDVVEVDEQDYCYGLGRLILRVIEVGRRERHSDGLWLNLRGIELARPGGPRQRRVLVRVEAIWIRRNERPPQRVLPPKQPAHIPVRPGWTCVECGQDWPCRERRRRLLLGYRHDRVALAVYLGCHLADAASNLVDLAPDQLYARFLGWLPSRSPEESINHLTEAEDWEWAEASSTEESL